MLRHTVDLLNIFDISTYATQVRLLVSAEE